MTKYLILNASVLNLNNIKVLIINYINVSLAFISQYNPSQKMCIKEGKCPKFIFVFPIIVNNFTLILRHLIKIPQLYCLDHIMN